MHFKIPIELTKTVAELMKFRNALQKVDTTEFENILEVVDMAEATSIDIVISWSIPFSPKR